ncbi:MAG: substrate-binding domain-containing protein [Sandaracinaceae bacterium]|nr:substrate-binding domain-containing protein [Sandaracinaceae bacterium]
MGGPDEPIVLYSRENNSGTYAYFKEHVLEDLDFAAEAQTLPGTAAVINAVSRDRRSIGYGGIGYGAGVRTVPVSADGGPPVEANLENATNGSYPLARFLYLYTLGEPSGLVADLLDWIRSPRASAWSTRRASTRSLRPGAPRGSEGALMDAEASAMETPGASAPARGEEHPRRLGRVRTPLWHQLAERTIVALAFMAIAAIVLIFAFIVKEALPLFWDAEALEELGGLSALFLPRQWEGYEQAVYVWQPVGGRRSST